MQDIYKKGLEKIAALRPADFNTEYEHWCDGNIDDSYCYGIECGEHNAANIAREILKSTKERS